MKVANRLSVIALNCCFHEPKLLGKLMGDHRFPMCGDAYQSLGHLGLQPICSHPDQVLPQDSTRSTVIQLRIQV